MELTIGMVRLVARWQGRRRWVLLGDGSYSCVHLDWEYLSAHATLITRLRLDARLFAFPAPQLPGRQGPKPKKGTVLETFATRVDEVREQGEVVRVPWYEQPKTLRALNGVCLR